MGKRTVATITIAAASLALSGCSSSVGNTEVADASRSGTSIASVSDSPDIAFVRQYAREINGRDLDSIASRQDYIDAVLEGADAACDSFGLAEDSGVINPIGTTSATTYYLRSTAESLAESGNQSVESVVKGWELSTKYQCPKYSPMIAAYQAAN
ncbi:hypothetical protein GS580_16880 [Rhodococcus hoagii]|nr:hypothetical protein [Prescottella equi]NKS12613.1 hypothetical protein [Prescottella equi]